MTNDEKTGAFKSGRARALLRQLKDENPNWTKEKIFQEWRRMVHQDESFQKEVLDEAFADMWQRTNKRFQN